jgi:arylsulfatase A-like enzyme
LRPAAEFNNTYSTPTFTARAVSIIEKYTPASPLPFFLYLPYQNVHWPLEVRRISTRFTHHTHLLCFVIQAPQDYVAKYANTTGGNHARNMVCAMAKIMDDGIGNVTAALKKQGVFDDTVIIFSR